MYEFSTPDKRRPVVILSRQAVIPLLRTVMVAPITSAVHGVPSEVLVGPEHGLKRASAINLDHVQTVDKLRLRQFVAHLSPGVMAEVCRAFAAATGCSE
jgi:mRNA interferase MazF